MLAFRRAIPTLVAALLVQPLFGQTVQEKPVAPKGIAKIELTSSQDVASSRLPVPSKSLPSNYLPTKFRLYIGSIFPPVYNVELNGETLTYRTKTFDEKTQRIQDNVKTIKPTPRAWARFWQSMNEIDVWRWAPNYPNPSVMDGTQWSIEIEYRGQRLRTFGSNNFPGLNRGQPPESETSAPYEKYLAAVQDLLGGESFR